MYVVVLSLLIATPIICSTENLDIDEKRALSSFDTLAGIGLGKRAQLFNSIDWLDGLIPGFGKRSPTSFDTLGGIGLGKRSFLVIKRAVSSFDTLGGIGLGKRTELFNGDKKSLSSFDTLAGIGLGKRSRPLARQYYVPLRAIMVTTNRKEQN